VIFNKVRLSGVGTGLLELPIVGASPFDQMAIRNLTGLEPPPRDVFNSRNKGDVGWNQGTAPTPRQIVMTVGLYPTHLIKVGNLRDILYGLVSDDEEPILFELMNDDTPVAQTSGHVSKFEAAIFTSDPLVQITIDCPSSYLEAPNPVLLTPGGGLVHNTAEQIVSQSTVPIGFKAVFKIKATVPGFSIKLGNKYTFTYLASNFQNNDIITYNSRFGEREIKVTRSGVDSNLLGYSGQNIPWLLLKPGVNLIEILNYGAGAPLTGGFDWVSLEYLPKYWGA
jgi:hypothetical protein